MAILYQIDDTDSDIILKDKLRKIFDYISNKLEDSSRTTEIVERTIVTTEDDGGSSIIDHGSLNGLSDDDHTQYIKVDGTRAFTGDQSMGSNKLTSVTDPTSDQDAATKKYVDDNATTPGGSNTHVQFNNGGAFGGDANFVWDNTNKQLIVGGETSGLGHFNVVDYDIDITSRHIGSYVYVSKTTGVTGVNDWLYGSYVSAYISDTGETHGLCVGQYVISHLADGSIGTSGTNKNMTGQRIDSNVALPATVNGNVYGLHIEVDHDGTISGDTIGIYVNDKNDNLDYGIYCDGNVHIKGDVSGIDGMNIICHNNEVVCHNNEVVFV